MEEEEDASAPLWLMKSLRLQWASPAPVCARDLGKRCPGISASARGASRGFPAPPPPESLRHPLTFLSPLHSTSCRAGAHQHSLQLTECYC